MPLVDTLWQLVATLGALLSQLLVLGGQHLLIILWVVWWLVAVNWKRAWPFLKQGAWVPLILLMIVTALVWSRITPEACDCLGFVKVPNFWWQLGYVGMLVAIMLICGWLQGVFHWTPAEVSLDPPAHGHGEGHHEGHHHDSHAHHDEVHHGHDPKQEPHH